MYIALDLESEEPIYSQLRNQVVAGIARGELKPGEALPSVRSLAADIGINFHTVNKAYQLLKQEGFILIHRQKGVVINPDGPPPADETYLSSLGSQLKPVVAEAACRKVSKEEFIKLCNRLFEEFDKKE
ncbi:GntR family transcriptional regulator [Bacillus sp. B-jedd]|uniref:GntR family transcriptional regulator n=1 Tax=Bacillus sp. B-jedd TaxID=1476857 RepID=UPI00051570A4|nr:GntR family transcriptional regulator [Bacillus sp. B-jedd]CEG27228.1 GntR family transcriptional regulator [Bacillus sp. B-jedd]